jgi:hypothetical protein
MEVEEGEKTAYSSRGEADRENIFHESLWGKVFSACCLF